MNAESRSRGGNGAALLGCVSGKAGEHAPSALTTSHRSNRPMRTISPELSRSLAEVRGQAQFLLYLADQIEDALGQLSNETDEGQSAFLARMLSMYSGQLETKHQGLGDRISETCQELYITVREFDAD